MSLSSTTTIYETLSSTLIYNNGTDNSGIYFIFAIIISIFSSFMTIILFTIFLIENKRNQFNQSNQSNQSIQNSKTMQILIKYLTLISIGFFTIMCTSNSLFTIISFA